MSYCRYSSMNWSCDVYVYECVSGAWVTHVAARRRMLAPIPDLLHLGLPRFGGQWSQELRRMIYPSRLHAIGARITFGFAAWWHNRIHMGSLSLIPMCFIVLPHAGESFDDIIPGECADRLEGLREMGYRVPQYAIDALRQEQMELNSQESGQ